MRDDAEQGAVIEATPEPARGPVRLAPSVLVVARPRAEFDASSNLDVAPERPPDPRREPPTPEFLKHRDVFANAVRAARELYSALLSDGAAHIDAGIAAAQVLAGRRQRDLDVGLADLDQGLEEARGLLAFRTQMTLDLLSARAAAARVRIGRAAGSALATLHAARERIDTQLVTPRTDRGTIVSTARTAQSNVTAQGQAAQRALRNLSTRANQEFPARAVPLESAENEAIALRLPDRVTRRTGALSTEQTAQEAFLRSSFATLDEDFQRAFADADRIVARAGTEGPAAVRRTHAATLRQLDRALRQMRRSIREAGASSDAAIVRQHDAARARLVASAEGRERSETQAVQQRLSREGEAGSGMAGAQSKAVRAVVDGLARERRRPANDFARAVIGAATGLSQRLAEIGAEQRPRLARVATDGRDRSERQSQAAGAQFHGTVVAMSAALNEVGRQVADALYRQADEGSAGFAAMAEPIGQTMSGYLPPVGRAYTTIFTNLRTAVDQTRTRVNQAINGGGGGGGGGGSGGGGATGASQPAPSPPTTMTAQAFLTLAGGIAADAKSDSGVADLVTRSRAEVPKTIDTKTQNIFDALSAFSSQVAAVMGALRGITGRQGAAITAAYPEVSGGWNIERHIRLQLPSSWSTETTNLLNVDAAINYLHGNNVAAALSEMRAAVHLWNDEARVEAVQRSLTPAQMDALRSFDPEALADVRNDLDGVDQRVFDRLQAHDVATADALRLRGGLAADRAERGDPGADAAVDRLGRSWEAAGRDALAGGDPLGLDDWQVVPGGPSVREERRAATWLATQQAFGRLEGAPEAEIASDPGAALVRYATAERDYQVFVPDDYPREHGPSGHYETVREGIGPNQSRLIGMMVRHGPQSEQVAGARLVVEMNRTAGRPRMDRLDLATHEAGLDAREGESIEDQRARRPERLREARARRERILLLYDQYSRENQPGDARTADQVRDELGVRLGAQFAGDPTAAEYARSMVRDVEPSPQAAFRYALAHESENRETLARTFGRMHRDEIDAAVAEYDRNRGSDPPLYERLGLHGRGSWWSSTLSGDARNEVEIAAMGVPRNTRERAEVSRMITQQQIRDSGFLGRVFANHEYSRMVNNQRRLEREMGLRPEDFDEMGRIRRTDPVTGQRVTLGRFNEAGEFIPSDEGATRRLEALMHRSQLTAESYKQATDRIATAVTTGLMIIAAVVTTALTGGAAASIWIPVLVTAGAGLVGIGLSMSIKGDRYTRADLERDLVVTLVQAATAGLGAAAGAALRGGAPALRAVGSRIALSEKVLERFMQIGARGGLRQTLSLGEEALIAGGSNALNSAAATAMDPELRRKGRAGEEAFHAGFRGFLGGALGSVVMRPIMRAGVGGSAAQPHAPPTLMGNMARRGFGSAFSGTTSRAVELGYDRSRGQQVGSTDEVIGALREAFVQNMIQGAAEARAEHWTDTRRAAALAARRASARAPSVETETAAARPLTAAPEREPSVAPRPPVVDEAEAQARAVRDAIPPDVRGDVASASRAVSSEFPPITAPQVPHLPAPEVEAPRTPVPRAVGADDEPTQRIVRPPVEERIAPPLQPTRPAEEPEPSTLRRPAPVEEAEPPTRPVPRPEGTEEPEPRTRRRPPPLPEDARRAAARRRAEAAEPGLIELPETSAMMPPDPRSRAQAQEMFHNSIRDDPSREVGLYVNSATGEHVLIQGTARMVIVAGDESNPVGIAGEGHPQRWKELLDDDRGQWHLVAHNHPGNADDSPNGWRTRLPSGRGGDFSVMMHESSAMGGATRHSSIAVMHEGRPSITEFAYDPSSPRPFAIIYDDPATGQRVFRRFKSLEGYGEFFERLTGVSPHIDTPSAPAAAPRPDEITLLHGTSAADAASIRRNGVIVTGKKGRADDFGAGFYLTFDTANAEVYATHRAAGRERDEGVRHVGEVLEFKLRLDDLGVRVDVRPGGEHRAAWDAFLSVPRGPEPDFKPTPPALVAMLEQRGLAVPRFRDLISGASGADIRGAAFDVFLASIGMSHADVVHGDLGGVGTTGIHRPEGGEQIAIRTPEAAARLTAALRRGSAVGGDPSMPRSVPPPEAISPPPVPRSVGAPDSERTAATRPRAPSEEPAPRPRTRAHDVDELFAEVQVELDHPAPAVAAAPGEPTTARPASRPTALPSEAGTLSQPTLDRLQAGARQTADAALAEMRAARGAEAARHLEELILLVPRVMTGGPETEVSATSRGPRWRVGLLDASTETIRDRRFAELPGALGEKLVLDPPSRARLAALLRARRADARPGESPRTRAAEVEATIARWERQGMNRREVRAYEAQARRLETYAQGEAGFGTARRASMRAEEDALRSSVDQRMRRAPDVEERDLLRRILRDTGEGWLAAFARSSMPLRGTRGWDVIEQWHAYLDNVAANNRQNPRSRLTPSQEGFERYMRRYMKGTQRPRLSELAAAEAVSQHAQDVLRRGPGDPPPPGLEMLKIALDIDLGTRRSRNEPSEAGTDYLGLRPGDGVLVYGDDKAHQATLRNRGAVEEVEAFVPNLATNMRADADMLDTRFAALRERGLAVEDRHAAVPDRLRVCAAALEAAFPRGITLRGRRAQARFRNILAQHKVELIVTAAAVPRGVDRVAPRLARAGVRFLSAVPRRALDEEDEEPPE